MPTNIKLYNGTTDSEDHLNRFASAANSEEWPMPGGVCRKVFSSKGIFKEPHEITKIARKANESLTAFKERWTVETGFIMGVQEVMKIASFMNSLNCPELAKRFSHKVPQTVEEMMVRLDDFVCFEEAFARKRSPHERLYSAKEAIRNGIEVGEIESFLVKDVRQRGRGNQRGEAPQQAKVINMIKTMPVKEKKRKARETTEAWMNPYNFPASVDRRCFRRTIDHRGRGGRIVSAGTGSEETDIQEKEQKESQKQTNPSTGRKGPSQVEI
ncbi:hypothetical protein Tco_1482931 [Tanacetum coccineum]